MPSSRHLVDPELLGLLDSYPALQLSDAVLPLLRAAPPRRFDLGTAGASAVSCRQQIAGPPGAPDVMLSLHRPATAASGRGAILHIHGGGYIAGSAEANAPVHRMLAETLDIVVASVDYRLAPETRFPGAIEDCYAALAWLVAEADALGIDAQRIGVMGESAGGGLAAALALLVRDRGAYSLAFQHLIYPMIDDRTCTRPDPHPFAGEFIWTPASNHFGWSALLGQAPGSDGVSPYAAAARATDLAGLPPAFIATGALDLFLEENLDYARRLTRAGVPTELHVYPGAFHGFQFAAEAAISKTAALDSQRALARALAR